MRKALGKVRRQNGQIFSPEIPKNELSRKPLKSAKSKTDLKWEAKTILSARNN